MFGLRKKYEDLVEQYNELEINYKSLKRINSYLEKDCQENIRLTHQVVKLLTEIKNKDLVIEKLTKRIVMKINEKQLDNKNKEINKKLEEADIDTVIQSFNLIINLKENNKLDDLTNELFMSLINEYYFRITGEYDK